MLSLSGVVAGYGPVRVLRGVDLQVERGEIVCLLGGNAAGKTTTLKAVLNLVRPAGGSVTFEGQSLARVTTEDVVARGIALVPESRRIFARMSVWENLAMGAYSRRGEPKHELEADLARVHALFPRLNERAAQHAGTLSGGEQQMLAIGRALMARPRLLLMDEPSMGLAPVLVEQVFEIIQAINREGVTILLVEQNAAMALSIADRGYVLQDGRIVAEGPAAKLLADDQIRRAYLGEDAGTASSHPSPGPSPARGEGEQRGSRTTPAGEQRGSRTTGEGEQRGFRKPGEGDDA
jgi:branched-chain amino acid transport system ATP-binding protein